MAGDPAASSPQIPEPSQEGGTQTATARQILPGANSGDLLGAAALLAALVATFAHQIAWMWERWCHSEYYGHGFLILPVSAYLVWRRREALGALPRSTDAAGLAIMVGGLLVHLVGVRIDVNFVSAFALVAVLGGLVRWLWGRRVARATLFPVAYLGFMVPVDRLLVDALSNPLQLLAAKMATGFGQAIGIAVTREGVNISIPDYTFEVAIACSGLKSLVAMVALAALYAYAMDARMWRRLALLATALPIALLANAVRVTVILLIAQSAGAEAAEGFLHGFSGLVVFGVGLAALYGVGRALGCQSIRDDM